MNNNIERCTFRAMAATVAAVVVEAEAEAVTVEAEAGRWYADVD